MPRAIAWILFAVVTASLPASAADPARTGIAPPTRIPDIESAPGPSGVTVTTASLPRTIRRAVVADAAKRFRVSESAIVIARAEKVTWSDASLGCPVPGRRYAQALVEGYRVFAKSAGGEFTYHTDGAAAAVLCADGAGGQRSANPPAMDTQPQPYPPVRVQPDK